MRIELRILSGARAGQTEVFDQPTILIGRKPSSDLRFDTHQDLDVSATHGEIMERGGRFYVVDHRSTNGTFVNGQPVKAETRDQGRRHHRLWRERPDRRSARQGRPDRQDAGDSAHRTEQDRQAAPAVPTCRRTSGSPSR